MNAFQRAAAVGLDLEGLAADERIVSLLERREIAAGAAPVARRRGWLVRRALLAADVTSLVLAYVLAKLIVSGNGGAHPGYELLVLLVMIPLWVVSAKLDGLYDRDEEHFDHSTVDEMMGVFQLVTFGAWLVFVVTWLEGVTEPHAPRLITFWLLSASLVVVARALARTLARRSPLYVQNTIILGAGHIGQLAARKILQHPEYKANLVGFVDDHPRERRPGLEHVALIGPTERLGEIVSLLDIERVIVAFSEATHQELLAIVRDLRKLNVQIDVVPRLFELVGPKAGVHAFEGLALVSLPPGGIPRASLLLKRGLDCVVTLVMLIVLAPLMALIAVWIRFDSPGPVLFRQERLGRNMRPFTVLKFRTMRVDTDPEEHRRYIEATLTHHASPTANGLFKLDRSEATTRVGRFLRKTSLDELPQLFNVLAGEMSLVGPRPCLEYETRGFASHHFERFLVPPGITGLWQVTARAKSTFGEALDMDAAYVRGWSLSLDLRLLLKTPFSLLRLRATT